MTGIWLAFLAVSMADMFTLPGDRNILDEQHFGIINGHITPGIPYRNVLAVGPLFAPPYASSNGYIEVRLFGDRVRTETYEWRPVEVRRSGTLGGIRVSSETVLVSGRRALLLAFTLSNPGKRAAQIPVQVDITGTLEYVRTWDFGRPVTKEKTDSEGSASLVLRRNNAGAIAVSSDLPGLKWEPWSSHWVTRVSLEAGASRTYHVAAALGARDDAIEDCRAALSNPARTIAQAREEFDTRTRDLFGKLPRFSASDKRLEAFYNRSLLHFLLGRWKVKEFVLNPYYGTGSVLGGCLANYLWDFGGPWELFPLYDPESSKSHIRQFLKIDLTNHYSFDPMTGKALGPFYPVNHEKIIFLIHYYALHTGDFAFLKETVNGKTIAEWAVEHAMFGDDRSKPVALIDYGDGNHHLELRGKIRYDYYVPDLNGRRYTNYVRAYEIGRLAGRNDAFLLERATALKKVLREKLWNPERRWYDLITNTGARDTRYTVQMFKLFSSPVLGKEEEEGLLSHLNESEFLSEWGLHSMAKQDAGFDQVDFDNGGGGNFTAFPAQIAERLYRINRPAFAEDIFKRILWWGERVPYWGDSFAANYIEYRKDTPLQCTFDASAGAQSIIFGMFGVSANAEGDLTINPQPPKFSPNIALTGLKIRGHNVDIIAGEAGFEVRAGKKSLHSSPGTPIVIPRVTGLR